MALSSKLLAPLLRHLLSAKLYLWCLFLSKQFSCSLILGMSFPYKPSFLHHLSPFLGIPGTSLKMFLSFYKQVSEV